MRKPLAQTQTGPLVLDTAERLFAERGFSAVSLREVAREAGVAVSSVIYHYEDKFGLLAEIYDRHTRPMNARRAELLGEATRIADRSDRLTAILRAYLIPAFRSSGDETGGGARFTRLRAMLSAEADPKVRGIIAASFDATTRQFLDAIGDCLPGAERGAIVWQAQFLLGGLYYTLVNPERIARLSDGTEDAADHDRAIAMLIAAAHAAFLALVPEETDAG
ncbi:TetR/AcrR family transcriptional regulator [Mangrovicoccus algicola]|uniref:TetR/AcrR family transcriptional regulator n=1 Tax=Mangrovicoccus algicola TaxID=2771008 RepID=A0A8J6YTM3_9RHOB|nr:TetR/AcrR family transcriptional regulator [Mangrovicoccus algicola]MBE3637297.1 TetR/AcrR family transcriptional regulator [Mangrovicoccus algicola]